MQDRKSEPNLALFLQTTCTILTSTTCVIVRLARKLIKVAMCKICGDARCEYAGGSGTWQVISRVHHLPLKHAFHPSNR
jgi:hypothetical protein